MMHLAARRCVLRSAREVKTLLCLPGDLYERVRRQVEREQTGSANDFIVDALEAYVQAVERKAIDDAFRDMAHDKQYQREALSIVEEFGG